jgi:hypothetical protein
VDVDSVLEVVTLIAVAVGGYFVKTGKDAVASAANAAAEEGAKAGVKAINWPRELAQELEKTRGTERQERRFDAYSALWKKLRRLALYDQAVPDPTSMGELSRSLSDWYFIEAGGLMLTTQAREFYFRSPVSARSGVGEGVDGRAAVDRSEGGLPQATPGASPRRRGTDYG